MIEPVFVDTNVLVYARDLSAGPKHPAAQEWMSYLWRTGTGRLSFQVLNEYYAVVTRKLSPGLSPTDARMDVRDLFAWQPQAVDRDVLEAGWDVQDRFGLAYWDALIVAAALSSGCRYLLTEDLQHGQDMDGLQVVSPFQASPSSVRSAPVR